MLTESQLAEMEARAKAATPGPWRATAAEDWDATDERCDGINAGDGYKPIVETDCGIYPPVMRDAWFIAHAREDVPALIAEVRLLRRLAEKVEMREKLDIGHDNDPLTLTDALKAWRAT